MDEIKINNEVTISDLKKLGRSGGVTGRLNNGEIITLKANYATRQRLAIVAGQEMEVELIDYYSDIYKEIRTLKRDHLLIARRVKIAGQSILKLTGMGYNKPKNKKLKD